MNYRVRRLIAPALMLGALVGISSFALVADEPPAAPAVAKFAALEDLTGQFDYYLERVDEVLASEEEFRGTGEQRLKRDANTLAVLSLALGLHEEDHKAKKSAGAMIRAARKLANAKELDAAKAAAADFKKGYAGETPDDTELKWTKVASLGQLMKQVPVVNTALKRGMQSSRFKRQAKENAGYATTLAVIAQASLVDTHEVKDPKDLPKWYEYCADMRDGAAAVAAGAKAGNEAQAIEGMKKMARSCDVCHASFRKEHD